MVSYSHDTSRDVLFNNIIGFVATALRLASAKLPVQCEFITRQSLPRVGNMTVEKHAGPANPSSLPKPTLAKVPVEVIQQSTDVPSL
jgi:hypothetical protein